jgi:4'-phosphopantetheinyl transferase
VLDIGDNEVDVWRASLQCEPDFLKRLEATLSDNEKNRAARFHFARDRQFFVAARGILRHLAGAYLKRAPSQLLFHYGPAGKPSISQENLGCPIRFNLSHARRTALYAFARDREVGIDLEGIRSDFAAEAIAERFFSSNEVAELRALPAELQAEGFCNCWTRKEAYVKARGEGLQIPLHSFDVALSPGSPAQFFRGVEPCWNLVAFTPEPNYVAALARSPCEIRFFNFNWPS